MSFLLHFCYNCTSSQHLHQPLAEAPQHGLLLRQPLQRLLRVVHRAEQRRVPELVLFREDVEREGQGDEADVAFAEALVAEQLADLQLDVGRALERELPARHGFRRGLRGPAGDLLLPRAHELLLDQVLRGHGRSADQAVRHLVYHPGPVVARLATVVEAEHLAEVDERTDYVARLGVLQHEVADRGRSRRVVSIVPAQSRVRSPGSVVGRGEALNRERRAELKLYARVRACLFFCGRDALGARRGSGDRGPVRPRVLDVNNGALPPLHDDTARV